jgi:hypothetical protein
MLVEEEVEIINTYGLVESLNSILHGLGVHYLLEANDDENNESRRLKAENKAAEIWALLNSAKTFSNHIIMENLIAKYGPELKKIKLG